MVNTVCLMNKLPCRDIEKKGAYVNIKHQVCKFNQILACLQTIIGRTLETCARRLPNDHDSSNPSFTQIIQTS